MSTDWISIHAHYHGELDSLLVDGVRPLLAELVGDVQASFFIRYWNGGPHVRVRVKPAAGRDPEALTALLTERLDRYLQAHPGGQPSPETYRLDADRMRSLRERLTHEAPMAASHLEVELPYRAQESAIAVPYVFDAERFGGTGARAVSEEHFCRSSALALDVVARTRRDRATRLTWALVLMAVAACALSLTDAQAADLFRRYGAMGEVALGKHQVDYAALLRLPRPEEQWESVQGAVCEARGRAMSGWRTHLTDCVQRLKALESRTPLDVVMLDYVHLLNNRLGIPLTEELYLSDMLARHYEGRGDR